VRKKKIYEKQTVEYVKIYEKKRYFVLIILKRDFKCEKFGKFMKRNGILS